MRIQANVEVLNRTLNMKTKAVRSSLALGKKPGNNVIKQSGGGGDDPKVFLMLSTAQNRAGTKFGVVQNIEKVFTKCVNEGKATVRLSRPQKDLLIRNADPIQLKAFLNLLKKILVAKSDKDLDQIKELTSAALNPVSLAQVTKPKDKMIIVEKKDYPITKGFPYSLKELKVNGINMKRMDNRIFKLFNLTHLDLSDNSLKCLPDQFDSSLVQLKELILAGNLLENFPREILFSDVSKSLRLLDLSRNQIRVVPNGIERLENIFTLRLNQNKLAKVSLMIGKVTNLRVLDLSDNPDLQVLPGSFVQLKLDNLHLSASSLTDQSGNDLVSDSSDCLPSLLDICIVECEKLKLRQGLDQFQVPGTVLSYWDTLQRCRCCGKYCHNSSHSRAITRANPTLVATTFVTDSGLNGTAAMIRCEAVFCSKKCLEKQGDVPINFY